MRKFLSLTDLHLNFLNLFQRQKFYQELKIKNPHGIFISGDIATGTTVINFLLEIEKYLQLPIYFVLGNHDLWNSSTREVRSQLAQLPPNLVYLSQSEPIALSERTALIGHDSFCDARWKEPKYPWIFLMDWFFIKDFRNLTVKKKYALMRDWASQAAEEMGLKLRKALEKFEEIIMITHFPLITENNGGWLREFWTPYNSCRTMYETIQAVMKDYPKKQLTIKSGHTHLAQTTQIAHNIVQRVGGAEVGKPIIQEVIYI